MHGMTCNVHAALQSVLRVWAETTDTRQRATAHKRMRALRKVRAQPVLQQGAAGLQRLRGAPRRDQAPQQQPRGRRARRAALLRQHGSEIVQQRSACVRRQPQRPVCVARTQSMRAQCRQSGGPPAMLHTPSSLAAHAHRPATSTSSRV